VPSSETCDKQLANRDACQLSEGHDGDCDHNDPAATAMVDARALAAANLSDFLHGN
jgi:hypothetical protein